MKTQSSERATATGSGRAKAGGRWGHRLLLGALSLLLAGCGQEPVMPIRIGLNAWPGYEFLYLAQERGFYREAGVSVELVELSSLADTRRAYERGAIDAFGTTLIDALQARYTTQPGPQIVRVVDHSNGADVIIARAGIKDVNALKGKRVGLEMVSLGVYILARALEKCDMGLTNVTTVYSDQDSMTRAMQAGELDAVVSYPPYSVSLLQQGDRQVIFSTVDLPGEVVDVLTFDSKVVAQRQAEVSRILRAFSRAVEFTRTNESQAIQIMAKREGLQPEEFKATLKDGITLLDDSHQARYLRNGGKLWELLRRVDWIMRQEQMIKGEERIRGSYTDRCLPWVSGTLSER